MKGKIKTKAEFITELAAQIYLFELKKQSSRSRSDCAEQSLIAAEVLFDAVEPYFKNQEQK